jgi:hypothetical protein
VAKSTDGGQTWSFKQVTSFATLYYSAIAVDPSSPATVYTELLFRGGEAAHGAALLPHFRHQIAGGWGKTNLPENAAGAVVWLVRRTGEKDSVLACDRERPSNHDAYRGWATSARRIQK